ncbi:MAG: hypothetical protein M0Q91_16260 [Methanoregula sp.]|jgi:hypothetical protein|nr:hypothetical protein [Methanoregula sp.]
MSTKEQEGNRKTVDFLNKTVMLPGDMRLPNWLRIILINSSPSPFIINRNDGDLFDKLNRTARLNEEHEAIVRLLAMIAYQSVQIREMENEIYRIKSALLDQMILDSKKKSEGASDGR